MPDIAALISGDDSRAEKAVKGFSRLSAMQQEELVTTLKVMLGDSDADQRWWAVRGLCEIPNKEAASLLSEMLLDLAPEVRQCAALGLRINPTEEALPNLLALLDDPVPLTSRLASDALAALGNQAVPSLLEQLERGSPRQRMNAMRTLAEIGDPQAVPALFSALDDPSMLIEYWANKGLERMGIGMTFFQP